MADEPYFTTAELRGLPDMSDQVRFPDARLTAARQWIEAIIERECGTSFVYRTVANERASGDGRDLLALGSTYVRTVSALTVDGTVYTAPQLAALYVAGGLVYAGSGTTWPSTSRGNITVTYTHGWSAVPPADLKEAAMRAARNWLLSQSAWSGLDSRTTSLSNSDGTFTISTPGQDRPTGWPDVDATIIAWRNRVRVPKVV